MTEEYVMTKEYIEFDPAKGGWPHSDDLFYDCQKCHTYIPSSPRNTVSCKCGNVFIDFDAIRMCVRNESLVKLFRFTLDVEEERRQRRSAAGKLDEEKEND